MNTSKGFLFGIGFKVAEAISEEFLKWMTEEHIPDIHATGCFTGEQLALLDKTSIPGFHTGIFLHDPKRGKHGMNKYEKQFRPELRAKFVGKWGDAIQRGDLQLLPLIGYASLNA